MKDEQLVANGEASNAPGYAKLQTQLL